MSRRLIPALVLFPVLFPNGLPAQVVFSPFWDIGFRGIGGYAGAVFPDDSETDIVYGLQVHLGTIASRFELVPSVEYWEADVDEDVRDHPGLEETRDFVVNGDLRLGVPLPLPIRPYVGAGVSIHIVDGRGEGLTAAQDDAIDDVTAGLNLFGGVDYPLIPLVHVFGEARQIFVQDVSQFRLQGGIGLRF